MPLLGVRNKLRGVVSAVLNEGGPGTVAVEHLSHFHCPNCGRWFSIGDAPAVRVVWTCPWCGKPSSYRERRES
jgi:predicted RNA-binding Zn-ribbon protein involved in translation (DUF1610 family)